VKGGEGENEADSVERDQIWRERALNSSVVVFHQMESIGSDGFK